MSEDSERVELTAEMVRAQLDLLVEDDVFRSSKRSVAFLRYVVEQTLNGSAHLIKERTIGVEVFGRHPSYDTNLDHIVRTAATELRKRLAIYYGDEKHRSELRMGLVPGSYIPKFTLPTGGAQGSGEPGIAAESSVIQLPVQNGHMVSGHLVASPEPLFENGTEFGAHRRPHHYWGYIVASIVLAGACVAYGWLRQPNPQDLFWKPVLDTPGPVLLAVGDVPNGPPTLQAASDSMDPPTPVPRADMSQTVPFADTVTIARVVGALEARGKRVLIRREGSTPFSDLREGPVVLIGAFNNEWSLRLTQKLRFGLALDPERNLIYIRDAKNPSSRSWSWGTNQPRGYVGGAGSPHPNDYALISRIRNSETGHVVVVIGGLYTYGTQAAGEFLTDPQLMQAVAKTIRLNPGHKNLQIVIATTVTDETPGPPRVLAVSSE